MWIDSGIHAREWITPAVNTWMLNQLLENGSEHPELLDKLDWYFLPLHNPDGYFKTREDDRMWRKTTSWHSGDACQGTDPNRNWESNWGGVGASNDSCTQLYHGPVAFSEIENRHVATFLWSHKNTIKFYMTMHSYSQMILLPWGSKRELVPGSHQLPDTLRVKFHFIDYSKLLELAARGNKMLFNVHGETYEVGQLSHIMYSASGGSMDWVKGVVGVPYTYTMELRDTGTNGFLLPPSQIIPNAEEVWAFHVEAARQIIKEFGNK